MKRLSILFSISILCIGSAAFAQLREEVVALERLYEREARQVLDTILNPDDYTLVVSALMRNDPRAIEEYKDKIDVQFLPGLTVGDNSGMVVAHNLLHELKQKVTIHVILSDDVDRDKDRIIQDVLTSKLHLISTTGDSVVIRRSGLPERALASAETEVLPDLSWKMWTLVLLLALTALAGFFLWLMKKPEAPKRPASKNPIPRSAQPQLSAPSVPKESKDNEGAATSIEIQARVIWLRDQLTVLAMKYPQLATQGLLQYANKGNEAKVVMIFEQLGWELSRKLFQGLPSTLWLALGQLVRSGFESPELEESEQMLTECYQHVLAPVVEKLGREQKNPFAFLSDLSNEERAQALEQEKPATIALISVYASSDEFAEILNSLDPNIQTQVLLETSRLSLLPDSAIRAAAESLAAKMRAVKESPSVKAQGAALAANVLRALPPERELEALEQIRSQDTSAAQGISQARVQFDDLGTYPAELVKVALEEVEIAALTHALTGTSSALVERIITLLPPKKGMMVQGDLDQSTASRKEIATARRQVCLAVEKVLSDRQISVADALSETTVQPGALAA